MTDTELTDAQRIRDNLLCGGDEDSVVLRRVFDDMLFEIRRLRELDAERGKAMQAVEARMENAPLTQLLADNTYLIERLETADALLFDIHPDMDPAIQERYERYLASGRAISEIELPATP